MTARSTTSLVGDVGDLRAFGLVVDLKSMTAAADVLGESKATTSRRISRLESTLGVRLLKRTSRVVEVTEPGRMYRQRIGDVLELLEHANASISSTNQEPRGDLRVAAPVGLIRFLAPLIASYTKKHPSVRIELEISDRTLDLDVEEIDVAFGYRNDADDVELLQLNLICVASPAYLKARGKPQVPADLKKHDVIAHPRHDRDDFEFVHLGTKKTSAVRVRPAVVTQALGLAAFLAAEHAGIAVVPTIIVGSDLDSGRLVRVLPNHAIPTLTLYLRLRRTRHIPSKVLSFRDHVRDYIQQFAY